MGRPPCCDKSNVKKGPWTAEEDAKILAFVAKHGIGNWTLVPQKAGLNRCGKSCRLRWTNYLRPDLKHDSFTPQEEEHILKLHKAVGSRWSLIAKQLPGRTDNDVKNHWNTKLRKKLSKMGIDPVTHKPLSQVLTDYGNITDLPNTRNQIGSLNNFANNMSMLKSDPSFDSTEFSNPFNINRQMIEQCQDDLSTNNYSWDNVAHFQVINQDIIQPHFFNEAASTSSSSSSCNLTQLNSPKSFSYQASQLQTIPSSPSSWSEFLLGDPLVSTNIEQKQECELQGISSSNNSSFTIQNETPQYNFTSENENNLNGSLRTTGDQKKNCSKATSSAVDSFVETILNRDSEMQLEFPELLDGYLDY